jgi:hypothetical protein|tara:strand:+ start:313 stop:756 length:444 start_codon:yes stop_codon:yes gene_type:complete
VVILSACSSISQSTNLEKSYIGKLNLSQNNLVSKFIIRINVFSEDTIIQVSKPILGNLIKIKFNQNDGITTNQELDSSILTLFNNFNKQEYTYFFNSCFNNLNTDKNVFKIIKNNIELKCEYKGLDTLSIFFVNDDIFSINGILKRE